MLSHSFLIHPEVSFADLERRVREDFPNHEHLYYLRECAQKELADSVPEAEERRDYRLLAYALLLSRKPLPDELRNSDEFVLQDLHGESEFLCNEPCTTGEIAGPVGNVPCHR